MEKLRLLLELPKGEFKELKIGNKVKKTQENEPIEKLLIKFAEWNYFFQQNKNSFVDIFPLILRKVFLHSFYLETVLTYTDDFFRKCDQIHRIWS